MKTQRQQQIILYLTDRETASMDELCEHFNVSMNTIRRDIADIVRSGLAEKVYGGVRTLRKVSGFVPYEQRSLTPSPAKQAICRKAADMVKDGDIVFIDSGTTTVYLIDALQDKAITVITNNIEIIVRAMEHPGIQLIVLPGELDRTAHAITGKDSADFLSTYNTNIAFMAATGVSQNGGVTNSIPLEYQIKKAAVAHTEKPVLLVTGNKFGVTSLMTYAQLDTFGEIITDRTIPAPWLEKLHGLGIPVTVSATGAPVR